MAFVKRERVPEPGEVNYEVPAEHPGRNPSTVHSSGYPGVVAKDGKYAIDDIEENRATTAGNSYPDVEQESMGLLDRTGARQELGIERGSVPAFQATQPGMTVMTIDIPSSQSKEAWGSLLQLLYVSDGIVVLRPSCECRVHEDSYLHSKKFLAQIWEIVDSRPTNIICMCNGPIRGAMMIWPAIAQLVLATKDATFGLPTFEQHLLKHDFQSCKYNMIHPKVPNHVHSVVHDALKKRIGSPAVHKRLAFVGDNIDANEAHRFRIADFVGDEEAVENELSRIIFSHCSPHITYYMHKRDLNRAVAEKEAEEEEDSDPDMPRAAGEDLYPF